MRLSPPLKDRETHTLRAVLPNKLLPDCRPLRGYDRKSAELQIGKFPVCKRCLLGFGGIGEWGKEAAGDAA